VLNHDPGASCHVTRGTREIIIIFKAVAKRSGPPEDRTELLASTQSILSFVEKKVYISMKLIFMYITR
jgi:hypothetical protein